ncbi:helix-turn-helix transcriptional regulator [Sphaerisporangium sp. NPDC005289]|uniref:helix-turn-helix domain-containing protein n=1 Tax=Sphaerisporangium sp. NPDC005289 TaxID=3155247 RepID=UPI0033A8E9E1
MANGTGNPSRSRRLRPLPDDLPEPTRVLLRELRALKERAGLDLRALEQATHASRSSWGRWLSGETWIPLDAVEGLARLCRADGRRVRELWESAEQARRSAEWDPPADTATATATATDTAIDTAIDTATAAVLDPAHPGPLSNGSPDPETSVGATTALETRVIEGQAVRDAGPAPGAVAPRGPAERLRRRFLVGAAAGLVVGMAAGVVLAISALGGDAGGEARRTATPSTARTTGAAGGTVTPPPVIARTAMIARAGGWRPATARRVPYSQFKTYEGYRTDGSGYVSMALGLPRPGPNTISLASRAYSRPIKMAELRRGDLVIDPVGGNTARAVVIFDKWADAAHTSYWAYQQRAGYGTDHRVVEDGLTAGSQFHAYRPVNLRDDAVAPATAASRTATATAIPLPD